MHIMFSLAGELLIFSGIYAHIFVVHGVLKSYKLYEDVYSFSMFPLELSNPTQLSFLTYIASLCST